MLGCSSIFLRAIPLKKQEGGEEILRDPLRTKLGFFNPLDKNGYFPYPPRTQKRIFLPPRTYFFLVTPRIHFTPLGQLFSTILPHSDSLF